MFAREEVPGQEVDERVATFDVCGVEDGHAREGKELVYHERALKVDHGGKGWGDHEEMRGCAHGETQANVRVEMAGTFPCLVLGHTDHRGHDHWVHDG